jgi:hypothetical protein
MYLGIFNTHPHSQSTLGASPPLFQGFFQVKHDRDSIVPTIYLCVSHTEALLMASNTSYHKHLHGSHRFACHILTLFATRRCLAALAHDLMREGNILLCFM